jgi:hypothetical protein
VTSASIIPAETGANSDGLATTMFPAATGDMRARQARTFRAVPWRETGENARWAPHADSSEPRGTLVSRTSPFGQIHSACDLCCKLPWGPADNVKESGNAYATEDLHVAANRTGAHSLRGPLVSSILSLAARCGGATGGTRSGSRSYDGLAMGAELRPRVRATTAPAPEADQQVVAGR